MDAPKDFSSEAVRDAKVDVLKKVLPIEDKDVLLGQYSAANGKPGYKDDDTVPKDSNTPTFAAVVLHIDNDRWKGVPFVLSAGKALDEGKVDISVRYKHAAENLFPHAPADELAIRVQPDQGIFFHVNTKTPGMGAKLAPVELKLLYKDAFKDALIPEAYEALILDALRGEHSNFVRDDELDASWSIFTPLLHRIDAGKVPSERYAYGSQGPTQLKDFLAKHGITDSCVQRHRHY